MVVERGDFLPREDENWSPSQVFQSGRYRNAEPWIDETTGRSFAPGVHYYVGGNTKVYGACLPRFRQEDFGRLEHEDGVSPEWPFCYADIEPYYGQAERLYPVHGSGTDDPTEPSRSSAYPFPALPHEPDVQTFAAALRRQGLHPFEMPSGVDRRDGGRCIRCRTCDGFPCKLDAKSDADVFGMRPALQDGNVRLLTRALCERLETSPDGRRIAEAVVTRGGQRLRLRADRFVVSCGAANSAALLLRSGSDRHPQGVANSSGLLGRNYMVHNSTFFMGVDPRRRNTVAFQKTLGLNDWYLRGPDTPYPLGNVQMLGKLQGPMLKAARRWLPMPLADYITRHSIDVYLTTEDLPDPANRITVGQDGRSASPGRPTTSSPIAPGAGDDARGPACRLPADPDPAHGHRDELAPVRHGRDGSRPAAQRPERRVPCPRRRQPLGRRQRLFPVVGSGQPRADDRSQRAPGGGHERDSRMTVDVHELERRLRAARLVPVVRVSDETNAQEIVERLLDAGLDIVEITTTVPGWERVVRALCDQPGDVIVGVGTITTGDQARAAVDAGAHFCVSPRLVPEARRVLDDESVPFIEGGLTPTEVLDAASRGIAKLFPAHVGGVGYLKSLLAIAPDARIMPTGGIALTEVAAWLSAGAVAVGIGSDLTAAGDIAERVAEALKS